MEELIRLWNEYCAWEYYQTSTMAQPALYTFNRFMTWYEFNKNKS